MLAAEERAGASHLLRSLAILRASRERLSVVLAAPDDRSLREDHKDGETGIWRMLETLPAGAVAWQPGGIAKLENGSTIQLTTWEEAKRRPADVLLLDDADDLPLPDFQRLRERALQGPDRSGGLPRLVVVSHRPEEGWIREHWRALNGEGVRVELLASELPERLRGPAIVVAQESFGDFIARVHPAYEWYPHDELQVETGQRVIDGEITRLIVCAPPRYRKSLVWSRFLPAHVTKIRPDEWFSVVSATADLALILSGDARAFYRSSGGVFRTDSQDKALWRTTKGGGMWARGVGGWVLGVGMDMGVFDDPFASWKEAQKVGVQDEVETYFWKDFLGRRELRPVGAGRVPIIVNHQRLAEKDLIGRLLKREEEGKHPPEGWHVLNLPALKRPRRVAFPKNVTVIPDLARWDGGGEKRERADGEPLCPQLLDQDVEGLLRLEAGDQRLFAATHQQDPFPDAGGGLFERWWWSFICPRERVEAIAQWIGTRREMYREGVRQAEAVQVAALLTPLILALMEAGEIPVLHREARAWDIAAALLGEGDASASVRGGVTLRRGLQEIIFTHAEEYHYPGHAVPDLIFETAMQDGPGVDVILPQEPAAAGKILIGNTSGTSPGLLQIRLEAAGFRVVVVPTGGSKRVRANPHAGAAMPPRNAQGIEDGRMGRCYLLPATAPLPGRTDGWNWNTLFCERHQAFDGVTKPLDLVDAASYLFSELDGGSFLTSGIR